MSTERPLCGLLSCLLSGWLALSLHAPAQAQSGAPGSNSGLGPGASGKPPSSGAEGSGGPMGQGPGYHSPQSQFPPLQEREGVVPWSLLSSVTTRVEGAFVRPVFPKPVQALNNQTVMVQGFMMPLEPGDKQRHFLLSSVPTTCNFCIPAGPEGLVEVRSKTPVRFTPNAIMLKGRLSVLTQDTYGMFYRLSDGTTVDIKTLK